MSEETQQTYYSEYLSPLCKIILIGNQTGLTRVYLETKESKQILTHKPEWIKNDSFFGIVKDQLDEYFRGERKEFTLSLNPEGTPYQKTVWKELRRIPYGKRCSYKDIASNIGNSKASRAIGMANGKNPLPLIVPCHRVVGSDGSMTGFAFGIDIKTKLLELEQKFSNNIV